MKFQKGLLAAIYVALGLKAVVFFTGCATYTNQVATENGGTITTQVRSFGAKVNFKDLQSEKSLGEEGYNQTLSSEAAGAEAQFRELSAVFLAGSQTAAAATGNSNQGLSPELFSALLDKIPGPTVVTNTPNPSPEPQTDD